MKKISYTFVILGAIVSVFASRMSAAQDQQDVSGNVQIDIQGKRYESMHAYRREQIKEILLNTLSSRDLKEFSEDELWDILKEVSKQKVANKLSPEDSKLTSQPTTGEDARDLGAPQMQEMFESYMKEHKEIEPLVVDPDKVKNVIIGAQEPAVNDTAE